MIFVDTNYFLRFLLNDQDTQHHTAKNLFHKAAEGKVELVTSLIVFFEIFWVLESFYEKNKEDLIQTLKGILDMEFVKLEERNLLYKTLTLYEKGADLEDAYHLTYAQHIQAKELATFDKKMQQLWLKPIF